MSFRNDYIYGKNSEVEILDKLRIFFKADLEIVEHKFSLFDYHAKDILIELKSRRCTKNFYESTMIGCNKLINAGHKISKNSSLKIIFVLFILFFLFLHKINYVETPLFLQCRLER